MQEPLQLPITAVLILGPVVALEVHHLYPALLHLVALAKDKSEKVKDILLAVLAISVMVFSTAQVLAQ